MRQKGEAIPVQIDLAGQKFGRLAVLYATSKRERKGFWHCQCDCGNEINVTQDNLVYGNYRSCGCLRQEIWKKSPISFIW